jgi:uncharacterized glyoxalase superfamily protein PhnB
MSRLGSITPCFIVRNVVPAVAFYRDRLGFDVTYMAPEEKPFFAMVERDGVSIMMKAVAPEVQPIPNSGRHPWAPWDAYVYVPDPDALAAELSSRGVTFHEPLGVNSDRLRGFQVQDADGYVLYFGRPE